MPPVKADSIVINVEPVLKDLVMGWCAQTDQSASAYIRNLILKDLKEKGLLTPEIMEQLLLGGK